MKNQMKEITLKLGRDMTAVFNPASGVLRPGAKIPGWLTPLAWELLEKNLCTNPDLVVEKARTLRGLKVWIKDLEAEGLQLEQRVFRQLGGNAWAAARILDVLEEDNL